MKKKIFLLFSTLSILPVGARDLFNVKLTVDNAGAIATGEKSYNDAEAFVDSVRNGAGLQGIVSSYNPSSKIRADVDFRGVKGIITAEANDSKIVLHIPSLNETHEFDNGNRDASSRALETFLKNNHSGTTAKVQRELVKETPNDPIAGNPASLQSTMVSNTYADTFSEPTSNIRSGSVPSADPERNYRGLIPIGLRFGRYSAHGLNTDVYTLPLGYTYRGLGGGRELSFHLPISYARTNGAETGQIGLGVSYRHPMNEYWSLTPSINVAGSASRDMASVGSFASVSLTSNYTVPYKGWDVSVGNMVGYYQSLGARVKKYSFNPDIKNVIFRNGIMASQPIKIGGHPLAIEYSFTSTYFTGTDLYNDWTNEFGITIGTHKSSLLPEYLRVGVSYLHGKDINGWNLNFGYWF